MPLTGTSPDAVRTAGLRKTFRVKDQPVEAVSGIDLTVAAGQIFGFLGPNGAGKPVTELRHPYWCARRTVPHWPGSSSLTHPPS